eukprot:1764512-Prymnesium_polylepis.1
MRPWSSGGRRETECRGAEHARTHVARGLRNPGVHAFCRTVVHVPSISRNVFTPRAHGAMCLDYSRARGRLTAANARGLMWHTSHVA